MEGPGLEKASAKRKERRGSEWWRKMARGKEVGVRGGDSQEEGRKLKEASRRGKEARN